MSEFLRLAVCFQAILSSAAFAHSGHVHSKSEENQESASKFDASIGVYAVRYVKRFRSNVEGPSEEDLSRQYHPGHGGESITTRQNENAAFFFIAYDVASSWEVFSNVRWPREQRAAEYSVGLSFAHDFSTRKAAVLSVEYSLPIRASASTIISVGPLIKFDRFNWSTFFSLGLAKPKLENASLDVQQFLTSRIDYPIACANIIGGSIFLLEPSAVRLGVLFGAYVNIK